MSDPSLNMIIFVVTSLLFSILYPLINLIFKRIWSMTRGEARSKTTYREKLSSLSSALLSTSKKVDEIVLELTQLAEDRAKKVKHLEDELKRLGDKEKEIKDQIDILEKVPVPAIAHLTQYLNVERKRSFKRDLIFFVLGVFSSIVSGIVIQIIWG